MTSPRQLRSELHFRPIQTSTNRLLSRIRHPTTLFIIARVLISTDYITVVFREQVLFSTLPVRLIYDNGRRHSRIQAFSTAADWNGNSVGGLFKHLI